MSLLTIQEPPEEADSLAGSFSFENMMPKLYEIFRDAVLSNNYPVIGLFMVGAGALLRIANADLPIFVTEIDIQTTGSPIAGGYTGGLLGDWIRQALGTGRRLTTEERQISFRLSDLLVIGGVTLMGSAVISKVLPQL